MTENWIDVCATEEIDEDIPLARTVGNHEIALYRVEDKVYATDNLCTHGNARLCDGYLEGHEIECPLHQGRFDIRDGRALCAPLTKNIGVYPVKSEGKRVFVGIVEST